MTCENNDFLLLFGMYSIYHDLRRKIITWRTGHPVPLMQIQRRYTRMPISCHTI